MRKRAQKGYVFLLRPSTRNESSRRDSAWKRKEPPMRRSIGASSLAVFLEIAAVPLSGCSSDESPASPGTDSLDASCSASIADAGATTDALATSDAPPLKASVDADGA